MKADRSLPSSFKMFRSLLYINKAGFPDLISRSVGASPPVLMTTTIPGSAKGAFCLEFSSVSGHLSTNNALYVGWFGVA